MAVCAICTALIFIYDEHEFSVVNITFSSFLIVLLGLIKLFKLEKIKMNNQQLLNVEQVKTIQNDFSKN